MMTNDSAANIREALSLGGHHGGKVEALAERVEMDRKKGVVVVIATVQEPERQSEPGGGPKDRGGMVGRNDASEACRMLPRFPVVVASEIYRVQMVRWNFMNALLELFQPSGGQNGVILQDKGKSVATDRTDAHCRHMGEGATVCCGRILESLPKNQASEAFARQFRGLHADPVDNRVRKPVERRAEPGTTVVTLRK